VGLQEKEDTDEIDSEHGNGKAVADARATVQISTRGGLRRL